MSSNRLVPLYIILAVIAIIAVSFPSLYRKDITTSVQQVDTVKYVPPPPFILTYSNNEFLSSLTISTLSKYDIDSVLMIPPTGWDAIDGRYWIKVSMYVSVSDDSIAGGEK